MRQFISWQTNKLRDLIDDYLHLTKTVLPSMTRGGERDWTAGTAYLTLHSHISSTPRALASFPNGGHYSGTSIYCIAWGDGCGPYYVDTDRYESVVKTSVLAFLEHLRGRVGAWEQLVYDDVVEWETVP